jgi:hypothetical protein
VVGNCVVIAHAVHEAWPAGDRQPEEVRQVSDGDRVVIANPRPRVGASVW